MAPHNSLPPITIERVHQALDRAGIDPKVTNEGDLATAWTDGFLYFHLGGNSGNFLIASGFWDGRLPWEMQGELFVFCQEWCQATFWPKIKSLPGDNYVSATTEFAVPLTAGVTDEQLDKLVECAVVTANDAFTQLTQKFPNAQRSGR